MVEVVQLDSSTARQLDNRVENEKQTVCERFRQRPVAKISVGRRPTTIKHIQHITTCNTRLSTSIKRRLAILEARCLPGGPSRRRRFGMTAPCFNLGTRH